MKENINMQISFFEKISKYIMECTPLFEEVIEMIKWLSILNDIWYLHEYLF